MACFPRHQVSGGPRQMGCAERRGFPPGKKWSAEESLGQFACPCPPKSLYSPKPHDPPVISTCASHSSELLPPPLPPFPMLCCSPCLLLWQLWASCWDRGGKPVCFQAGEGALGLGWSCSAVLVYSCQQRPSRGLVFTGHPHWLSFGCCNTAGTVFPDAPCLKDSRIANVLGGGRLFRKVKDPITHLSKCAPSAGTPLRSSLENVVVSLLCVGSLQGIWS